MFSRVYVEITNVCNKSCGFCHGTKREKRFMSPDEFRRICAGLRGHTRYICLHLMGEPLLHPELETILDIAKEEGLKVCITTNGSLSDARGELLSGDRLYKLSVSLHSFEENGGEGIMQYLIPCGACAKGSPPRASSVRCGFGTAAARTPKTARYSTSSDGTVRPLRTRSVRGA